MLSCGNNRFAEYTESFNITGFCKAVFVKKDRD